MDRYHSSSYGKRAHLAAKIRNFYHCKHLANIIPENKAVFSPRLKADAVIIVRLKGQPQMQFSTSRTPFGWTISPTLAGRKVQQVLLASALCLFLAVSAFGQSEKQLWALSQIESGMNPTAVGRAGEVTEYQTTPCVLQEFKIPISATLTRTGAKNACKVIWGRRIDHFRATHHREPTDYETALLWHCPSAIGHPNSEQDDFATRFANLFQRKV